MHFCHATMKSRIQLSNHPLALWVAIYHEIEKLSPQFIQRKLSILKTQVFFLFQGDL